MIAAVAPPVRWFAMLEPASPPPEWTAAVAPLAALAGGTADAFPHLTVGGGDGDCSVEAVGAAFAELRAPSVMMCAASPVSHAAGARLHLGWTFKVAVEKDEALRGWYARANAALVAAGVVVRGG